MTKGSTRPIMKDQTPRMNMIKQQLRTNGVLSENILSLYDKIPRDAFVPQALSHVAYSDSHLPLPHDECMMTPLEEGQILESLSLTGNEHVLEIGTGTGFLTTLLSHLAKHVTSIDYYADFTEAAEKRLRTHGTHNTTLITGDASLGWLDKAPYDVVVYTGALEKLSDMHKLQVVPGGKLFAVTGEAPAMRGELHELDRNGGWHSTLIFETVLPLLVSPAMSAEAFTF